MADVDDFYNNIGYGGIAVSKIALKLKDEFDRVVAPTVHETPKAEKANPSDSRAVSAKSQSVIIDSVSGCEVKFAKCCNPLPGDSIIGFITKGFGVSVHKYDCSNAQNGLKRPEEKDRWVVASWSEKAERQDYGAFEAMLNIYSAYSPKMIADVTVCLSDMRVAVTSVQTHENGSNMILTVGLKCSNIVHLRNIIAGLKKLPNVHDVARI